MEPLLYVPADSAPRIATIGLTVLRYLIAAFFVFVALKNLSGDTTMASEFQRWGYPDWFRVATAVVQLGAAALLVSPRIAFFGALLLTFVMLGAVVTHLRNDPPATLVAPFVFLALVSTLLVSYRPPLLR